jgi:hypothetical protein
LYAQNKKARLLQIQDVPTRTDVDSYHSKLIKFVVKTIKMRTMTEMCRF